MSPIPLAKTTSAKNGCEKAMPHVAIVIPCFNAGVPLLSSVKSAIFQTHQNRSIIVVNDGSTDHKTLDALDQVRIMPGVKVVDQETKGASAARNRAIAEVECDYIQPLDADDMLSSNYVEQCVARLESKHSLGVAYGCAQCFGARTGPFELPAFSEDLLAIRNMVHIGGMFRYVDWLAIGGYREELLGLEDYDLWIRMRMLGRDFARVEGITYFYRQGQDGVTASHILEPSRLADVYAAVFRANIDFFASHAEQMYLHRFVQEKRISELESLISRLPKTYPALLLAVDQSREILRKIKGILWN